MVESTLQRYTLNDAQWHYEHGLHVMALQKVGEATGEERYLKFATDWVDCFVQPDGGIHHSNLDTYNTALCLMALRAANKPEYEPIVLRARQFLVRLQVDLADKDKTDTVFDGGVGYGTQYEHSDMSLPENTRF